MCRHKYKLVSLAVLALAIIGADEPEKVEFKGWFSNPVFSADGKVLAYARLEALPYGARTAPTQIILWDVKDRKEARRINGPADDSLLGPVALSPDGKRLAIGMWNTALRIWDLEAGKEIARVEKSQGAQQLRFTADGRTLGWVKNNAIHRTDAATGKEVGVLDLDVNQPLGTFAFVDDGKTVLTSHYQATDVSGAGAGKNRTLEYKITCQARDGTTGKVLRQVGETATETRTRFQGRPLPILFVTGDGKSVIRAGANGRMQVCDWATGKKERDIPIPGAMPGLRNLALSGNGQVAALASAGGTITVWDLAAGKEIRSIHTGQSLDHIALSPDGKRLAVTHQTPGRVGAVLLLFAL